MCLQHVCLWPDLGGSSDQKKKVGYGRYKRKLTHDLLYELFGSVREAQANGGFRFESEGEMVHAYPVMCLFVSDTPERQLLSLVFGSAQARYPCSMCGIKGEFFPNTQMGMRQELRTQEGTNTTRLECLASANSQTKLQEHSRTLHMRCAF